MKLTALNLSLCRVSAFSNEEELADVWPALKDKIRTASPSFYKQISALEAEQLNTMSDKIQYTIWKYFNRAKYRATPFANFASYSVTPLHYKKTAIKVKSTMLIHKFANWEEKFRLNLYNNCNLFYANTSAYYTTTEIRYLQFNGNSFELASAEIFPELKSIMQFCRTKRSKNELFDFMKSEHQVHRKQCNTLILQLLHLQLLQSDRYANITGEDYFTRLKISHTAENYILAERDLLAGGLDRAKTEEIAEALRFLAQHLRKSKNRDLENFKNAFIKRFEHQEVTLTIAMDPELGIGYGNLAQYEQTDELIDQLTKKINGDQSIVYTALHRFLINGLMTNEPIDLQHFREVPQANTPLPNTLSVLCQFYKNHSVVSHAGGCTASALLGRFTLANAELEAHCKEIAELEQNANPKVLFFDIPYQAESKIDNVNRRKNCYEYELPILTWSCQPTPLDFEDVMVSIQGNDIVLRSRLLGKRLIPRLASAYNYSRSDLAVYRFLCDLQHQSIQSSLTFDFQTFVPGLDQYPRVSYKNVILSPAKWLIPKSLYQQSNTGSKRSVSELQTWLQQNKINFLVKTGVSDQTLCFNPDLQSDLFILIVYCKQQGDRPIYLSEALIDKETSVTDQDDKKYNSEFVISFSHSHQVYREIVQPSMLSVMHRTLRPTIYLLASEWLYFEIFVEPSQSNKILRSQVTELLKEHKNDIGQWFFIRYDENGKHIRLRLHVKDLTKRSCIIDHFNSLFKESLENGVIKDVALKPYRPELARYGAFRMNEVENFFHLDSKLVLSFLSKMPDKNRCYQQAIYFMEKMSRVCLPILTEQVLFVKQMAGAFSAEFNIEQDGFKKINHAYSQFKKEEAQAYGFKQLENQANVILAQCNDNDKPKMLADLIHMHVNRVFNDHQRLHEAVCYQFFYKRLLTKQARLSAQGERQALA